MKSTGRHVIAVSVIVIAVGTALMATPVPVQPDQSDIFHPHDSRVFKTTACTTDHTPVEALYYIVASRTDMAAGKASPSSNLMQQEVGRSWQQIASRLTAEQMMEERFAEVYHAVLNDMIPRLEQAVEKGSGVSISVTEVNSRPMDPAKDKDAPACGPQ
jgi:hypothetical protein